MGLDYQLHRVSVDVAKGFQQLQKASTSLAKDNVATAVHHLNKALNKFDAAAEHAGKAADAAYTKAGSEIDKGKAELSNAINAYEAGDLAKAESHYESAVAAFDDALDLIG